VEDAGGVHFRAAGERRGGVSASSIARLVVAREDAANYMILGDQAIRLDVNALLPPP
jgi:hypothetical protein